MAPLIFKNSDGSKGVTRGFNEAPLGSGGIVTTTIDAPTYSNTFGTFDSLASIDTNDGAILHISSSMSGSEDRFNTNYFSLSYNNGTVSNLSGEQNYTILSASWNLIYNFDNQETEPTAFGGTGTQTFGWSGNNSYLVSNEFTIVANTPIVISGSAPDAPYFGELSFNTHFFNASEDFFGFGSTEVDPRDVSYTVEWDFEILFNNRFSNNIDVNTSLVDYDVVEEYSPSPPTPSNLSADMGNSPFITLDWNTLSNIDGYNLYLNGDKYNDTIIARTSSQFDVVLPDGNYEMKVTAVQSGEEVTESTLNFTVEGIYEKVVEYPLEDFENYTVGEVPDFFNNASSPTYGWYIDNTRSNGGTLSLASDSAQAGDHGTEAVITMSVKITQDTELSFDVFCSAEESPDATPSYDYFRLDVDGTQQFRTAVDSWNSYSQVLTPGEYILSFVYRKDSSVSGGDDRAWIDNFSFLPV